MLKKLMIISLVVLFSLSLMENSVEAQTNVGGYRVGLQSSYRARGSLGLSVIYDRDITNSFQGILSVGSNTQTLEGRYLNRFKLENLWNTYSFVAAGLYNGPNNTGFLGGGGIGVEYDIQALEATLPPVSINADLGVFVTDLFNSFDPRISIGFHYRF